jgi:hypothetical protein
MIINLIKTYGVLPYMRHDLINWSSRWWRNWIGKKRDSSGKMFNKIVVSESCKC